MNKNFNDFSDVLLNSQRKLIKTIVVNGLKSAPSDDDLVKFVVQSLEEEVFFNIVENAQNQIDKVRLRLITVMKERDMLQKEMDGIKMVLNSLHVEVVITEGEDGSISRINRK